MNFSNRHKLDLLLALLYGLALAKMFHEMVYMNVCMRALADALGDRMTLHSLPHHLPPFTTCHLPTVDLY